jgi:hypothetical protein
VSISDLLLWAAVIGGCVAFWVLVGVLVIG